MPAARSRVLDARPDTLDFRDKMFQPTLIEVPSRIDLDDYRRVGTPVLDQGFQGACTGFGLATVANYLLRKRRITPDATPVSPRMLYEMARRHDEWPGRDYEGSSARGAMKGWHTHGVCSEQIWPFKPEPGVLTDRRAAEARGRPLGAYYRVNHKNLVDMHSAIAEVGVLFASGSVHRGWLNPVKGVIQSFPGVLGGHAFAIVAYDENGFWIQSSWGTGWGLGGFGRLSYDDWLTYGTDVWVARLGVPVKNLGAGATAQSVAPAARSARSLSYLQLRPHIISIGNDGYLNPAGAYGMAAADVEGIFRRDFPRITGGWETRRILLYASGGLTPEASAVQRVAEYRATLLDQQIYPLSLVWRSDLWTTLGNIVREALARRRPEGVLDAAKDFMLDRLDDALEPLIRALGGKAAWDEMKENALLASSQARGAGLTVKRLGAASRGLGNVSIHLACHSAGAILMAPLVELLASTGTIPWGPARGMKGYGMKVASCTLWAPACSIELFRRTYLPLVRSGQIERFALFTLTDQAEQDDNVAGIYRKSLLYLVSRALEEKPRVPLDRTYRGVPLLGLARDLESEPDLVDLFSAKNAHWVRAPNTALYGSPDASTARSHGDFDTDRPTLAATLARIKGSAAPSAGFTFRRSNLGAQQARGALSR